MFCRRSRGFSLCEASSNTQLYVATTYNWAKAVALDGPRRFALDQTRFHLDGHGISSVTRPDFVLDLPGSALDPAESYSCTLRKALPLQSAKGLHPLYSGPIKHKRIILSTGIILLSFIGFSRILSYNPALIMSFHATLCWNLIVSSTFNNST